MGKKDKKDEPLRPIRYQLKKYTPVPLMLQEYQAEAPPTSPSEWFSRKFPEQSRIYGPPVLESVETLLDQTNRVCPVSLNEDFFAAILGGDKQLGHHVVFYLPEQQFYFFDCRFGRYDPTSEQKLILLLSQYLIQCAADMPGDVEIQKLFVDLRKEEDLKKVVRRAKALLAADETFFGEASENKRLKGVENHGILAKRFVRDFIKPDPGSDLTFRECYGMFSQLCQEKGLDPMQRRLFKSLIAEFIREEFDLGLRHDVTGVNDRQQHGWRGLTLDLRRN